MNNIIGVINMKSKTMILLAILLFIGLVSCDADPKPPDVPQTEMPAPIQTVDVGSQPPGEVVNWMGHWMNEDKRETLVLEAAQEFAFLNQDITVNLKFPQEIMGVRSKPLVGEYIANMIRTGNIEWDIIWLDDQIYQYAAEELDDPEWGKRYLVDFEQVAGFQGTQKTFIIADPTYREQTGGILVGPYLEGYYHALFYNADLAAQMGIEIKQQGMSFEDLLGYVKAVQDYNQQNGTDIAAFYEAKDWPSLEILFQHLLKSEIEDFAESKANVTSEEKQAAFLKTLQAFEELGKYDPLISSHNENIWFETRGLILEDKALFYVNGTWMYSHWRQVGGDEKLKKMIPVEMPAFQQTNHYSGGYIPTWAVMKFSPNRENAIKLMMFWSTPKVAEKWIRYTKNPTGIAGHMAIAEEGADPFELFQHRITDQYGPNVQYSANVGYIFGLENQALQSDVEIKIRELLTGQTTAEEAYEQIISQLQ